ncbi:formylglycine-generating enzyme family protein [Cereibacter sphaeroides]|uniref:formylglycine-generating enzyme family protein n=1 Tax=Cereibacter sphaeroides TaxID=1063 RepID=UPI003990DF2B
MIWLPGAVFYRGSDSHYPEEAPVHLASVEGFWIDVFPVTNADYARFVSATGYVTVAERSPGAEDYPDADPALLVPGSLVFRRPASVEDPGDWTRWWSYQPGARWRHPDGPGSDVAGRLDHPVVHVCHEDAQAYAHWAGKDLPTEAEWEYAARGGLDRAEFAWGDVLVPEGRHRANIWQGQFPVENLAEDGFEGTSPVRVFPPNGYGLYDMIGNVWEWTSDGFRADHGGRSAPGCCAPISPASGGHVLPEARRVLKGGSHLCAPNYCRRYRPAARQGQTPDSASGHIGFRCVLRPVSP